MSMRRKLFAFSLTACLGAAHLYGAGVTGADVLNEHPSARAVALGNAYVALGDDLGSLTFNPAGLANLKGPSLTFLHHAGIETLSTEILSYGQPLDFGTLAGGLVYRSQDDIANPLATDAPIASYDFTLGIDYATSVSRWLPNVNLPDLLAHADVGMGLKYLRSHLGMFDADDFTIDLGMRTTLGEGLIGGVSVINLGPPIKFINVADPLPSAILVGVARNFQPFEGNSLNLAADAEAPFYDTFRGHLGVEDWLGKALAIRVGYVLDSDQSLNGLSAGFGFKLDQEGLLFNFDYAYSPYYYTGFSSYEGQHLFQMSLGF
jgi:hypothetical protein